MPDRQPDNLLPKTKHQWEHWGWDSEQCRHCRISPYETQTLYCEDVAAEKIEKIEKAERRHKATEEAIEVARKALTAEQWKLLELNRKAPYRDKDYIRVDR